jgi:hypothetical protein
MGQQRPMSRTPDRYEVRARELAVRCRPFRSPLERREGQARLVAQLAKLGFDAKLAPLAHGGRRSPAPTPRGSSRANSTAASLGPMSPSAPKIRPT